MKNDPNELLEDGGTANDAEKALKSVGVQLRDSQGEFRDLDDVLDELGATWESLTRNQKAYLATTLAGSRQSSRFLAIMNNYDRTLELVATSQNSVGASMSQYAIYEDSAAAAQNRLTAEIEKFQVALTGSDEIKTFTGGLAGIVNIGNSLGPTITGLTLGIGALGVSFMLSTSKIYANVVAQKLNTAAKMNGVVVSDLAFQANLKESSGLTGLLAKITAIIVGRKAETAATLEAAAATTVLNVATGGAVLILGAIVVALGLAVNAYQNEINAKREAYSASIKLSEQSKTEASNLQSSIKRYKELTKQISLTSAEQDELITLQNDLATSYPLLVDYIDAEGNARLKNLSVLEKELKIKQQLALEAAQDAASKKESLYTGSPFFSSQNEGGNWFTGEQTVAQEYSETVKSLTKDVETMVSSSIGDYVNSFKGSVSSTTALFMQKGLSGDFSFLDVSDVDKTGNINYAFTEEEKQIIREQFQKITDMAISEVASSMTVDVSNIAMLRQGIENSDAPELIAEVLSGTGQDASDYLIEEAKRRYYGLEESEEFITQNMADIATRYYDSILSAVGDKENQEKLNDQLKEAQNLYKNGTPIQEIEKKIDQIFIDFGIMDYKVKEQLSKTVFDSEEVKRKIEQIVNSPLPTGTYFSPSDIEKINAEKALQKESFKNFSAPMLEWISQGLDQMEPVMKEQYVKAFAKVADNPDALAQFAEIFKSTDFTSPQSVKKLENFLISSLGLTQEAAQLMIQTTNFELSIFIESIKKGFATLKQIASDMKKSLSGEFSMGDAIDMMQPDQYGPGAIETVGGEFFLSAQSIENKRRVEENKLISDSLDMVTVYLDRAADGEKNLAEAKANATVEMREEIEYNKAMAKSIRVVVAEMMKLTDAELAIAQNQNVLDAVGAINTSLESLSSYGDLFERLTSGSMGLLEIMTALGTNPELIQALDVQNGKLVFQQEALIGIAREKKNEVSQYLTGELKKLEAVQANIDAMIAGKDVNEDAAMSNLDALGAQEEGMVELGNKTIEAVNQENLAKVTAANVDTQTTQAFLDNAEKKINAQLALNQAIKNTPIGGRPYDAGNASKASVPKTSTKGIATNGGDFWSEIGNYYGIDGGNANNKEAISKANKAQIEKYKALIAEWNDIDPETLLAKGKSKSGGGEDAFESYLATFDKFFNFIRKIEELTKEASKLQAQIDLKATDGFEDIELMKKQAQGYANKAAALTQYNKALADEADAKRKSMKEKYGSFVDFDANGKLVANTQAINNINIDSEEKEKWFEGLEQGIEDYNDLTDKIDDNTEALLANQKALEDMYDAIRDEIINTSDAIYQALLENDKKAVQDAEEKFNKLKQLEDDYLSAVKTAIDKERKMRSKTAAEAELVKEQRKLAVLKRDTSGSSAKAILESENKIASLKTNLEDSRIDDQLSALEEQISLAQQQRDLQIQNLNALIQFKEENGLYWQQVDQTIAAGPAAIVAALQSTDTYLNASKLEQTKLAEDMTKQAETLSAVFNSGKSILGVNDVDVQLALAAGLASITQAVSNLGTITGGGGTATGGGSTGGTGGGGSSGSSSGSSGDWGSPPSTTTPTPILNSIAMLQTLLNKEFNAGLVVDGITGKKTKQAADGAIDKALIMGRNKLTSRDKQVLVSAKSTSNGGQGRMSVEIAGLLSKALNGFAVPNFPDTFFKYKNGGLVDYTGPAWVDGTRSRPEAFLNPDQTELVSSLVRGLENRSSDIMGASISLGEINVYVSNTNATAQDIGAAVRNEILKTFNGRTNLSIIKNR